MTRRPEPSRRLGIRGARTFMVLGTLLLGLAATGPAPVGAQAKNVAWTSYSNGNQVWDLAMDGDEDTLWAATRGGAVRWDLSTGTYAKFTVADGLLDNGIHGVEPDLREAGWWFATDAGVSHLDATGRWTTYTAASNVPPGEVTALAVDPDSGEVWVGTSFGGIGYLPAGGKSWARLSPPNPPAAIRSIGFHPLTGDLWVATEGAGALRRTPDGTWFRYPGGTYSLTVRRGDDVVALEYLEGAFTRPLEAVGRVEGEVAWFGRACPDDPAPENIGGGVALIERGLCEFTIKVRRAQDAGATAVIVFTDDRDKAVMDGDPTGIEIPGVMIDRDPGLALRATLESGERVVATLGLEPGAVIASDRVYAIGFHPTTGDVWLGHRGAVSRMSPGGEWVRYSAAGTTLWGTVRDITVDPQSNAVWFAASDGASADNRGIAMLSADGVWTRFTTADGLASNDVRTILIDGRTGTKWFGTEGAGVSRLSDEGEWSQMVTTDGPGYNALLDVAVDHERGEVWVGSAGGASRLGADSTWTVYVDPLPDNDVWSIAVDPQAGDRWFGTDSGLARLTADEEWETFTVSDGLAQSGVTGLAVDPATGDLWVGHIGAVSRRSPDGSWERIENVPEIVGGAVVSIDFDPGRGKVWLAVWGKGVVERRSDGQWTLYNFWNTPEDGLQLTDEPIREVAVDRATGDVWIASLGGGLNRLSADGEWDLYLPRDRLLSRGVTSVAVDPATGDRWIGTVVGVSRLAADGSWTHFTTADGLANENVYALAVGSHQGEMWFATEGGLSQLTEGRVADSCARPLAIGPGAITESLLDAADTDTYRFEVPEPFSRIEANILDPEDRLSLTLLRGCGRSAGTGSGRHIGGELRVVYDVTTQTGPYYLVVAPAGPDTAYPYPYTLYLSVTAADPAKTRTLVLTHKPRIQQLFGLGPDSPELAAWQGSVERLAADPHVGGLVIWNIETGTSQEVDVAYDRWIDTPGEVSSANAVARALRDWIWSAREHLNRVQYIVILGDDRVIPHYRLAIRHRGSPGDGWITEDRYMEEGDVDAASSVGAALLMDRTLTDDFYAAPALAGGTEAAPMLVPELAVGRLVETPEQMRAYVEAFLDAPSGRSVEQTLVAGYDFMQDATDEADLLFAGAGIGESGRAHLAGRAVSKLRLEGLLLGMRRDTAFVAAHSNHYSYGLPDGDTLTAENVQGATADLAGTLVYSLACHGGLNVPGPTHRQSLDLPEAWLSRGSAYVSSTGWSYGMDRVLAYQERLMVDFTSLLVSGSGGTVGDALVEAKRGYASSHEPTALHAKTIAGTVLYGVPMQRVRLGPGAWAMESGPPAGVPAARAPANGSGPASRRANGVRLEQLASDVWRRPDSRYPFAPGELVRVDEPEGTYFTFGAGRPRAEAGEPVQPLFAIGMGEVSRGRQVLEPRGVVITGGRFREVADFRPLVLAAGAFGGPPRPAAPPALDTTRWYPAVPVRLRRLDRTPGAGGLLYGQEGARLLIAAGQYHAGRRIERLLEEIVLDEYYSGSPDRRPPAVTRVTRLGVESTHLRVDAFDDSGVARVVAAYATSGGAWKSTELVKEIDGGWHGTVSNPDAVVIQVVDTAGNVTAVGEDTGAAPCEVCSAVYLPAARRG